MAKNAPLSAVFAHGNPVSNVLLENQAVSAGLVAGFYADAFDGATSIGAKKGNRSAYSLPLSTAIPTGSGTPFRNLRGGSR